MSKKNELKKFVESQFNAAKKKNPSWQRMTKKRVELVFSGKKLKELNKKISETETESIKFLDNRFDDLLGKTKEQPPETETPTTPLPPAEKYGSLIFKGEILFAQVLQDLEEIFERLNLDRCVIFTTDGNAYDGSTISDAITSARASGHLKDFRADYSSNCIVDVYKTKKHLKIVIIDEWSYERKRKKSKRGK